MNELRQAEALTRITEALEGIETALIALTAQTAGTLGTDELTEARRLVEHFRAIDRKKR